MTLMSAARVMVSLIIGAALVLGIPAIVQAEVSTLLTRSVNKIMENPASPDSAAISELQQLNTLCFHFCTASINAGFQHVVKGSANQYQLGEIYKQITGGTFYSADCSSNSE